MKVKNPAPILRVTAYANCSEGRIDTIKKAVLACFAIEAEVVFIPEPEAEDTLDCHLCGEMVEFRNAAFDEDLLLPAGNGFCSIICRDKHDTLGHTAKKPEGECIVEHCTEEATHEHPGPGAPGVAVYCEKHVPSDGDEKA